MPCSGVIKDFGGLKLILRSATVLHLKGLDQYKLYRNLRRAFLRSTSCHYELFFLINFISTFKKLHSIVFNYLLLSVIDKSCLLMLCLDLNGLLRYQSLLTSVGKHFACIKANRYFGKYRKRQKKFDQGKSCYYPVISHGYS